MSPDAPAISPVAPAARGTATPVRRWPRRLARGLLAGPVCVLTAALVMAGAALWLPPGPAAIDNIVLPIVLLPVIWALLFFHALLDRRLLRAWLVSLALAAGNGALIARHLLSAPSAGAAPTPAAAGVPEASS